MTREEYTKTEQLKLVKEVRVKEVGETTAKVYKVGDIVKVSGLDKIELLERNLAVYLGKDEKKK